MSTYNYSLDFFYRTMIINIKQFIKYQRPLFQKTFISKTGIWTLNAFNFSSFNDIYLYKNAALKKILP